MFERFTEKAIKVVTIGIEEAVKSKHPKLYPEHILLGILIEGSGISARFIRASTIKEDSLRKKVNKIVTAREEEPSPSVNGNLPFSPLVNDILKESWDHAKRLGANYITQEHIFLALITNKSLNIPELLSTFNVDVNKIKTSVEKLTERKDKNKPHPEVVQKIQLNKPDYFTIASLFNEGESDEMLKNAVSMLKDTSFDTVGTEQLILSLLNGHNSELLKILEDSGITKNSFVNKINELNTRKYEYEENQCVFTPKAYYAVNAAFELSKELGSAVVKPEHILLGILKEKKGLAFKAFEELGVNTKDLYIKIFKPIEKQKPTTLTILRLAKEETRRLGQNTVGTEQILLGILGEAAGTGAIVLKNLGITLKDARCEVEKIVGYGNGFSEKDMAFTPRAKKLLETAWSIAKKFNQSRIESEHLLLGITSEKDCMAMKALQNLGVDSIEIREGILKIIGI